MTYTVYDAGLKVSLQKGRMALDNSLAQNRNSESEVQAKFITKSHEKP